MADGTLADQLVIFAAQFDAHSDSTDWYADSVRRPYDTLAGFRRSREFTALHPDQGFPPRSDLIVGEAYHQVPSATDNLKLERLPAVNGFQCLVPGLTGVLDVGIDLVAQTGGLIVDGTVAAVRKVGQVTVEVVDYAVVTTTKAVDATVRAAESAKETIVDLGHSSAVRLKLFAKKLNPFDGHVVKQGAPGEAAGSPAYAWLPVVIPPDAVALTFDLIRNGEAGDNLVVFGLAGTNRFSLEAKFVGTNAMSTSRMIDVSAFAGTTNELFFGVTGDTSSDCAITVENIVFHTFLPPQLTVESLGNEIVLSWPSTANGYAVEAGTGLTATNWNALPQLPALFAGRFSVTNAVTGEAQFFRLRRQ